MVEADSHLKLLLPASTLHTYIVFEHIDRLSIGIQQQPSLCWNYKLSITKVKMATAMLPLFEAAKRGNSDNVLKKQQSLHSQKLRTIVVQKYHLR